ncbi:glycosyltransferase family 2 protein [Pseudonocardia sp. KRD291]|uniref:glycosyltransferase family 2 protein n=1 Tax=Pseudonocardia sp. KRD291 TaxID=2792007 RepID=UPI001C4A29AB|nr:glycosyltransferase [Pseudonocardia sp. KRD291]MBW0101312.1 glycosyltransferase [Pseudonocardia sp. KRD291]
MTPSRTTVVIATRNRCEELATTLSHLRELDPAPPVVVVDNASTDDTAGTVRGFAGTRLVSLPGNDGAAARNAGVRYADTPYVAFSDDDSWWAPDALARAEAVFDAHPRLGLLAATTLVGPQDRSDPVNAAMAASPLPCDPSLPGPSVLGFLACAAVVRADAYRQVGGFSALLRFGAEETLLACDLAASGWAVCHVPQVRAHHHPSPHRPDPDARAALELRNRLLIAVLRRPGPVVARAFADTAERAARDPVARRALGGALRRLAPAWRDRRVLPHAVERDVCLLADGAA